MKRRFNDTDPSAQANLDSTKSNHLASRCIWTEEEDTQLSALAKMYKGKSWDAIADALSATCGCIKSARQCRERWHNHLNPVIKDHPWTKQESDKLIELHQKMGNKWSVIASMMNGRTDNSIKNFFFCKLRKTARTLKYGVASLELEKGEAKIEEVLYLLDYLFKYYISPEKEQNIKKTITPQIKGRKNAGDKYISELLKKEAIDAEKFEKYFKDLLAILTPTQVNYVYKYYPQFCSCLVSETDESFSQRPSLSQLGSKPGSNLKPTRTFCIMNIALILELEQFSTKHKIEESMFPRELPIPRSLYEKSKDKWDFVPTFYFSPYSAQGIFPLSFTNSFEKRCECGSHRNSRSSLNLNS